MTTVFPPSAEECEPIQLRVARALHPLASSQLFARSVAAGIRTESAWRSLMELELRLLGRSTQDQRRRRNERLESAAGLAGKRGRRRPLVNWHEGGSGPALLLLNGWTASGLAWPEGWVRALEERFRVIRVDNRGTGWSRSARAPYTLADLADDARDVLRACDVEGATVLGISMGGMIAQELAMRHPTVVQRLILVATAPPIPAQLVPEPGPFLAGLAPPAPGVDVRDHIRGIWSAYAAPSFATRHPEVFDELTTQIVSRVTPRWRVLEQLRAVRSWHGSDRLRGIAIPTVVVHGDLDPMMPVGNGMRLSRLIPGAQYRELKGVGHLPAHEAGAELLHILESDASRD